MRINDDELYRALRQVQTFEDYDRRQRLGKVAVVYSNSEWIETLNKLGCDPLDYWNSSQRSANEIYSKIIDEKDNLDGVMPILNGSTSEARKAKSMEEACNNYGLAYLDLPRTELIEKNKATGFSGVIEWLEETRKNQF